MTNRCKPVRAVNLTAPARLHFGMFSFGRDDVRQFGGVGVMVEQPALQLRVEPAERFDVRGQHTWRVRQIAERVLANLSSELGGDVALDELELAIEIKQAPREHIGLGSGTQLGLGLVTALTAALGLAPPELRGAARLSGRGVRSAIGSYGFKHGGLLIEAGKHHPDELSPLVLRTELPAAWTFILFTPNDRTGLYGEEERAAFAKLPPVPDAATAALAQEALLELAPAAIEANFPAFSASLHRFNRAAGLFFAAIQGGPYAPGPTTILIEQLRALGIEGVGQSSWGPTAFACYPTCRAAEDFLQDWKAFRMSSGFETLIAPVANHGYKLNGA